VLRPGTPRPAGHALVIDDERDVLDLLDAHLSRLGFRVTSAQTGEQGLDLAAADRPDVVVVDVMLPGIDGREVVRRMRADPELGDCAIVVCSVLDRADLGEIEADAVLTKPFGRAAVEAAVNKVRRSA
jgi:DNA-binding response OmpR family regulator